MQEIQIGDYIKTKKGLIAKVCAYQDLKTYDDKGVGVTFHSFDTDKGSIADIEIEKHSKSIINLIEDGDYLNGYLVRNINGELCNFDLNNMEWTPLKNIDIFESLVTKQQFENIEYKI